MKVVVVNALNSLAHGNQESFRQLLALMRQRRFTVEAITHNPLTAGQRFADVRFFETPGIAPGVPALARGLVARWRRAIMRLSSWLPGISRLLPAGQRNAIKSLRNAGLIVAAPGNYLAEPALPPRAELGSLWLAAKARAPLVMAPMSISEPASGYHKRLLRRVLHRARYVFVREAVSEMFCRDLGVSAILSNDIGFLDDGFSRAVPDTTTPTHIAVTVLTQRPHQGDRDEIQRRYLDGMISATGTLGKETGLPVRLIVQDASDMNTARQIANSLSVPATIVDDVDSPQGMHSMLLESYCLIASRFGSAMQALAAGCPVAALTSQPAHRGILHLYGLDELGMPLDTFDADTLSAVLLRWGNDRTGFRQRCASLRDSLRRVGDPFVDCLASVTVHDDD